VHSLEEEKTERKEGGAIKPEALSTLHAIKI
jgi:hypothetical protein